MDIESIRLYKKPTTICYVGQHTGEGGGGSTAEPEQME